MRRFERFWVRVAGVWLVAAGSACANPGKPFDTGDAQPGAVGSGGSVATGSGGSAATGSGGSSVANVPGSGGSAAIGSGGSVATGSGGSVASGSGGNAATGSGGTPALPAQDAGSTNPSIDSGTPPAGDGSTVGSGDIDHPAIGPAPERAGDVGGAPFVLVKNWDFGSDGTIPDLQALIGEFQFHDQFNTIANGSNYGAVTVAATQATAISAGGLGLPNDMQPVEDASRPYRELTPDTLKTYVRPLSASQSNASVSAHDAGNGSITAKWTLAGGGALLGKDLLWETRARMPKPAKAYWFAIWTAGNKWNKGAEMDVLESFGTPNIYPPAAAFHVNSVGGSDAQAYGSWPSTLDGLHVPMDARNLEDWHVWTWVYLKDDSFTVYMDGYTVQTGSIHWTLAGTQNGEALDMWFLFDFGWGHTQISDVNISLPASEFPIEYEIDYSRVYLR